VNLTRLRAFADKALGEYRAAGSAARVESEALKKYKQERADAESARVILQTVAERVQSRAHEQLTTIVTKALRAVFGKGYGFGIDFRRVRGKTDATVYFLRHGVKVDPMSDSGGARQVAAFALRLSCLLLSKLRPLLILDEPFAEVSAGYVPRVRALLETLAEELGLQVIMVTHDPKMACGKIIKIGGCDDDEDR
jgi:DNA repair exonuclease SbcCD ATPase subunit